jgi:replicative DNA helicase
MEIPNAPEYEEKVLGCIFMDPQVCIPKCIEVFERDHVFYDLRRQNIFDAILAIYDKNEPVDEVAVVTELKRRGNLDTSGGYAYVAALQSASASSLEIDFAIERIVTLYRLRSLVRHCQQISALACDIRSEPASVFEEAEKGFIGLASERSCKNGHTMRELITEAVYKMETMYLNPKQHQGIQSGYIDLDKMTDGFHPGELIVLAARPSVGKSALAMNMVENIAVKQKIPVGVFSMEMTGLSLVLRVIASVTGVSMGDIKSGMVTEGDMVRLGGRIPEIAKAPIHICDEGSLSIQRLRSIARRMFRQHGVKLFVVDYMQLMNSTRRTDNRTQEVTDVSNGLKAMAKELGVPVLAISQLNRDIEKAKGRKPVLADLKESGSIEQDADLALLLYRVPKNDEEEFGTVSRAGLIVAKQRNGPTGEVPLVFRANLTRFESSAKIYDQDIPKRAALVHNDA